MALAMLAMVLAVSVPAITQEDLEACDFDGDDFISEDEAGDCEDALEDFLGFGADVEVFCADDDDGDGSFDEDGDDDGDDDDEDGAIDEDDDCDPDELLFVVEF